MITFESDYVEGCHEDILERFKETNYEQLSGYGNDHYTVSAKEKIKKACKNDNVDVHFLSGGTQTNQIVIDSMLQSYQGVICCSTGHIAVHEAGAIEFTGHKVLTVPSHLGLMHACDLEQYLQNFYEDGTYTHMVQPGMVYITYPSEYGTLYTKKELKEIHDVCSKYHLPLFLDGARLGYGLMSPASDIDMHDLTELTDVFYIGGTKIGALIGEAVVFTHHNTPECFFTSIKQHGALLAKGRVLGITFDTLFTDDLYLSISKHAIDMAMKVKQAFIEKGYKLFMDSYTNQQFIILDKEQMERISKTVHFEIWEKVDDAHYAVRFATSWATKEENVDLLISLL